MPVRMWCTSRLLAVAVIAGVSVTAGSPAAIVRAAAAMQTPKPAAPRPAAPKAAAAKGAPDNNALPLPARNPVPMSEASVKAGRVVYAKICRACHGLQGKGDGISAPPGSKPANLVDAEWKYGGTDPQIFKTIKGGIKPFDVMEPWGKKITDPDIWNTVNFLRDLAAHQKK